MAYTPSLSVTVENNSGTDKNYFLFTEQPEVSGGDDQIWTSVFATVQVPNSQTGQIYIQTQWCGAVGSWSAAPKPGVTVNINGQGTVNLGQKETDSEGKEKVQAGTTMQMTVRKDYPQFGPNLPADADENCFEITTDKSFREEDSVEGNFAIGLSTTTSSGVYSPAATFKPHPSQTYDIQPSYIYYIVCGNNPFGTLIDFSQQKPLAVKIDFTGFANKGCELTHNSDGTLAITSWWPTTED